MTSLDTSRRLQLALANTSAASEIEAMLGGFLGAKVRYVYSGTGVDSGTRLGESWDEPFATLDYAIGRCTASQGDVIIVRPGHAETTTAVALDVAGIRVFGLGRGRNKPTFTATTAATDLFNVTAANVSLSNLRLVGAASGCTALLDLAAADFEGVNLRFEHGAAPVMAVTVGTGASRFRLVDCEWYGTAAGPDCCIDIETGDEGVLPSDWAVIRARANYGGSSGLDLAFLRSVKKMTGYLIEDPIVIGFDTLVIDINSSSRAAGDGVLIGGGSVASTGVTIANVHDVGGCAVIDHAVTDDVAAKGKIIPAATPD